MREMFHLGFKVPYRKSWRLGKLHLTFSRVLPIYLIPSIVLAKDWLPTMREIRFGWFTLQFRIAWFTK